MNNERKPVVLNRYPTAGDLLREDVRAAAPAIVERHGLGEWQAALIASEMHQHLGIYSILGVKMGIRAREILDAPLDALRVRSHAGLTPPLSCLNDGLQVATGATLGHGLIEVVTDSPTIAATFSDGDRSVSLRLKLEVASPIELAIERAIKQYDNLTSAYFTEIRRLALDFWLQSDRREIFEETTAIQ